MDSSAQPLRLRISWRYLSVSFILSGLFLYLFLRETAKPPVQGIQENVFLVAFVALSTGYVVLAFRNIRWINDHLPPWLRSRGIRIVLYMIVLLVLKAGIDLLPLPKFYVNVLQHSAYVFCLPIVLLSFQDNTFFLQDPVFLKAEMLEGKRLVLRPKRSKGFFLLAASVVMLLAGLLLLTASRGEQVIGWAVLVFSGLGAFVGVSLLVPGCTCLILDEEGFVMVQMWRRFRFLWSEVDDFTAIKIQVGERVAWNVSPAFADSAPAWRRKMARRNSAKRLCGRDAFMGDDYGLSAHQFCSLMRERKANWLRKSLDDAVL